MLATSACIETSEAKLHVACWSIVAHDSTACRLSRNVAKKQPFDDFIQHGLYYVGKWYNVRSETLKLVRNASTSSAFEYRSNVAAEVGRLAMAATPLRIASDYRSLRDE